ncbi:hypothetical protein D3C86_771720 [compost metagenome]
MNGNYSPVSTNRDRNPSTVGDQMETTTSPAPQTEQAEPSPGDANNNWNLRDVFVDMTIDDYDSAVKKGFRGTLAEWVEFLQGITQPMDAEALVALLPTRDEQPVQISDRDVENAAIKAAKVAVQYRTGPFVRLVMWMTAAFMFLLAAMGGAVAYVATNYTTTERVENIRPCALNQDGIEISGNRSYSYIDHSLFGYHWSTPNTLLTKTTLNVSMKGLTAVAITGGESKTVRRGEAEGGIMILPDADYYAFFSAGRATGVAYNVLCK